VEEVAKCDGKVVNFVSLEAILEVQGSERIRRTI